MGISFKVCVILTIWFCISVAEGSNVLFFNPFLSKSMVITYMPIVKELAQKGHQVTIVSPHLSKSPLHPNIKEIVPKNNLEETLNKMSEQQLSEAGNPLTAFTMFESIFEMIDLAIQHQDFQALLKDSNTKFDAVIVTPFFGNEIGYYFAHKFKAPLILYSTSQSSMGWVDDAMGQPHNTAYLPTGILPFTTDMNFMQRAINTLVNFLVTKIMRNQYILGNVNSILEKHFPGEELPDLTELEKNASLSLSFSHPLLLDGWRPTVPNHVSLGMMNCIGVKELEANDTIRQFLDNAKEGVIYVSFGSVIRGSLMPKERRQIFLNSFRKLNEKILWKWETEEMDDKPDNVMLSKWLPQQEVLAHPNVKMFVTHGGQSSFQETLCHKKPVVVIPVTADQPTNGVESERLGIGISIPFKEVTEEKLTRALETILSDPSYTAAANDMGTALMDQINRPLDRAVWWIEHIMRNPTLYSRKSPVHNLTWFQYFLLDVFAFYILILTFVGWVFYRLVKCCFRCQKSRNKNKKD